MKTGEPLQIEPAVPSVPPASGPRAAMVIQRFRPKFTGQGVQVEQLCAALARRGAQSTVLTAVTGRAGGDESSEGYTIRRLRSDLLPGSTSRISLWAPTYGLRVLAALLRERPDLVHVHGPTDGLIGAWLYRRLSGAPLIVEMTLVGDDDPVTMRKAGRVSGRLRWRAYRAADAWVAMSEAFLEPASEAGLPRDRIHVIPQAVDVERFRPADRDERRRIRRQEGLPEEAPVAIFVGTLGRRKGVDLLLEAWPEVRARQPEARLLLAGSVARDRRDDLALRLDALPDGVQVRGFRNDPERLLRASDLFVFPSRREGFGSVIIEAMACGLPCVVAELPGITDWVLESRDGPAGVVVPQDDAGALASAMLGLMANPGERERLGLRARRVAELRFALDTVASRYLELYRDLLDGRKR